MKLHKYPQIPTSPPPPYEGETGVTSASQKVGLISGEVSFRHAGDEMTERLNAATAA